MSGVVRVTDAHKTAEANRLESCCLSDASARIGAVQRHAATLWKHSAAQAMSCVSQTAARTSIISVCATRAAHAFFARTYTRSRDAHLRLSPLRSEPRPRRDGLVRRANHAVRRRAVLSPARARSTAAQWSGCRTRARWVPMPTTPCTRGDRQPAVAGRRRAAERQLYQNSSGSSAAEWRSRSSGLGHHSANGGSETHCGCAEQ